MKLKLRIIWRLFLDGNLYGAYIFARSLFWGYASTRCHQCGQKRIRWDCWNCPTCAVDNILAGLEEAEGGGQP